MEVWHLSVTWILWSFFWSGALMCSLMTNFFTDNSIGNPLRARAQGRARAQARALGPDLRPSQARAGARVGAWVEAQAGIGPRSRPEFGPGSGWVSGIKYKYESTNHEHIPVVLSLGSMQASLANRCALFENNTC